MMTVIECLCMIPGTLVCCCGLRQRCWQFYGFDQTGSSHWARAGSTLTRWLWGALCCGLPGVPCYFCTCCERIDETSERERPRVNQSTGTFERLPRPHRPHAPMSRKSTPETLSAVRCALSQLQGEPAPPPPPQDPPPYPACTPEPG